VGACGINRDQYRCWGLLRALRSIFFYICTLERFDLTSTGDRQSKAIHPFVFQPELY
jgi:hypothetical protein